MTLSHMIFITRDIDKGILSARPYTNTNTNKIYIAPGILKRIGAQTHGVD